MKKHKQTKWYPQYYLNSSLLGFASIEQYYRYNYDPNVVTVVSPYLSDAIHTFVHIVWVSMEEYEGV